jgi:hypothetical protein
VRIRAPGRRVELIPHRCGKLGPLPRFLGESGVLSALIPGIPRKSLGARLSDGSQYQSNLVSPEINSRVLEQLTISRNIIQYCEEGREIALEIMFHYIGGVLLYDRLALAHQKTKSRKGRKICYPGCRETFFPIQNI